MLARCLLDGVQELIARTVAVAMGQNLPTARKQAINQRVDNMVLELQLTDIICRPAFGWTDIGLGHPRSFSLR